MLLNFSDRTRTGAFSMIWPLADNIRHFAPIYTAHKQTKYKKNLASADNCKNGCPHRRAVFTPRGRGQRSDYGLEDRPKKDKKRVFLLNKNDDFT